jgi:uncharacterized DUF497 family protein
VPRKPRLVSGVKGNNIKRLHFQEAPPCGRGASIKFDCFGLLRFEWNPEKGKQNYKKHGITFQEAATVFGDIFSVTFPDPDHSSEEERYITVGMSEFRKVLVVSHVDRGDTIRIISARRTTRHERKYYEEEKY